ncbi:cell division protein DivIVA [Knoellia sinensis KCTC 19936]|uniref:Cell division protein DivIVA n=1 Tax=Knoellia sinensis KCTC 19936 TaxID=1385520 RepID=A0A0A0JDE7_9MICO|nr:hypothetical protein [Knoellia sinensis]KGN33661.1 cell division protein DivIVA [Knoellia sinensis KCTC 19936]
MEWVALGLLAVAVIAVTALVATGRVDAPVLPEATSSVPPLELPEHPTSADITPLRLGTALHGYAPAEVDRALERRQDRLAEQERALEELRGRGGDVRPDA